MDAHGVDVFHGADGDGVALGVPHGLKFDLLPAGDALLHQHLGDGGHVQTVFGDDAQLLRRVRDAAAGAAQGKGGTDDDGIADLIRDLQGSVHVVGDGGGDAGLADGSHGFPEKLPVLRLVDAVDVGAQQADAQAVQRPVPGELHGDGQSRLSAEPRQKPVRAFLLQNARHGLRVQRL